MSDSTSAGPRHSLAVRLVWFLLIGWWAAPVVIGFGFLFSALIVTMPIGVLIINYVPWVLTLKKPRNREYAADTEQYNILVRAVWVLFVGWWLGSAWAAVAYVVSLTIVGLPVGIWMLNRLPFVVSLYQY